MNRLKTENGKKLFTEWYVSYKRSLGGFDCLNIDELSYEFWVLDTLVEDHLLVLQNIEFRLLPLKPPHIRKDANNNVIGITATGAQTNSRSSVFINTDKGIFFNRTQAFEGKNRIFNLQGTSVLTQTQFAALLILHN